MLQKFKNQFSVPPGRRWFYQVPGGRFIESVFGFDDIVLRVSSAYREIGVKPPENVPDLIQDFMCQSLPDGFCTGRPTISSPTWHQIKSSTEALVRRAERAGQSGPQMMQVLESRVKACQACVQHDLHCCVTCNGLLSCFDSFRRGRRTSLDRNVRVCRISAALLPVAVHVGAAMMKPADGFAFPKDCWVTKET